VLWDDPVPAERTIHASPTAVSTARAQPPAVEFKARRPHAIWITGPGRVGPSGLKPVTPTSA
jgi:hypothetical protein